jgi:hypothetical protein
MSRPNDDQDSNSIAAAEEEAGGVPPTSVYGTAPNNENKWSKNGFGMVTSQRIGKFSHEESDRVRKAVEDFCTMKQISVARLCSECDHKAELKGAWMEIAKRLPHRSVQSVYRHGLRQLHPFKRGAWADEECESLVDMVHRLGKKWSVISRKLNRSADGCRDKYREMSDDYIRGRWKDHETQLLHRLIRDHLRAAPSTDIRDLAKMAKMAEAEGLRIPWSLISKRMEKRSRLSCFKKWQKMTNAVMENRQSKEVAPEEDSNPAGENHVAKLVSQVAAKVHPRSKPRLSTHSAPTAGAAAALAASMPEKRTGTEYDHYLLTEIASFGATRASQIDWEALRLENAEDRWYQLVEELESDHGLGDSTLTVSELAQAILDRKTSAQRAAETVEAVDLPAPESLNREV